jgi:hypothetical protein
MIIKNEVIQILHNLNAYNVNLSFNNFTSYTQLLHMKLNMILPSLVLINMSLMNFTVNNKNLTTEMKTKFVIENSF